VHQIRQPAYRHRNDRVVGDDLRARTPEGRKKEQMLRVITYDLMILLSRQKKG